VSAQDGETAVAATPPPKPKREKPSRPTKAKPSALELVEQEVERAETRLAEVERKLAEDWGDVQLADEHRAARQDLEALLQRWESMFEQAQS
jgi:DNA repair exonuclease SbcCD ATPase subunit